METEFEQQSMLTVNSGVMSSRSQLVQYSTQTLNSYRLGHTHLRYHFQETPNIQPCEQVQQQHNLSVPVHINGNQINNNRMSKTRHHNTVISEPREFSREKARLPLIKRNDSNKTTPCAELSESALEQKLVILPRLSNNPDVITTQMNDPKVQLKRIPKEHYFRSNPIKDEQSMRVEKKLRKQLSEVSGMSVLLPSDEDYHNSSSHHLSAVETDYQGKVPASSDNIAQKQRVLTDVTINDSNYTHSPLKKAGDASLVRAFVKKGSMEQYQGRNSIGIQARRRRIPNRKDVLSNYNRSKRFITDKSSPRSPDKTEHDAKKSINDKQIMFQRSETHPIAASVSLFDDIQTTIARREPSISKLSPQNRNKISFFNTGRGSPAQRIKQLQNRLQKLEERDRSPHKTNVTETTVDQQRQNSPKRQLLMDSSWRHISVNSSKKHLAIEQSSFSGEVARLQKYINRNGQMIKKYITHRKDLIESVLNTQISQHLHNISQ